MDTAETERTQNVYEEVGGYEQPPLPPLPQINDLNTLSQIGIQANEFSEKLIRYAFKITGFSSFYKRLEDNSEPYLRKTDLRGGYLFSPVISATLALRDDPIHKDPFTRAACLVLGAYSLFEDLHSGKLEPDRLHGQVMEMGQYPNLYSTCLIVDKNQPRLYKSAQRGQITLVVSRRFYTLHTGYPEVKPEVEQIRQALFDAAAAAQNQPVINEADAPGLLTAAEHATQLKCFRRLQKNPTNAQSMIALRNSFLTLCLDLDSYPATDADAAKTAHSGNFANRWYHSSLQVVVFGNGKACIICNFNTYIDGNIMMRGASEIHKRAEKISFPGSASSNPVPLSPAVELKWEIPNGFMQQAVKDVQKILDPQQATYELPGYGRGCLAETGFPPTQIFTLALQLATRRLTGQKAEITQFLTMSRYRCTDLVTGIATTPKTEEFLDYLELPGADPVRIRTLLKEAIDSQADSYRQAREYLPIDEFYGIYLLSLKLPRTVFVIIITLLIMVLLRLLGMFKPAKRDVIISHPKIYSEICLVGRPGIRLPYVNKYGLHYQIFEDNLVIIFMPGLQWNIPNTEFASEIRDCLDKIRQAALSQRESGFPV